MIKVIPAVERHSADWGWLQTRWLFSFDDYYDPANTRWGDLTVFNDDVIAAGKGFRTHPHREMEIITLVLEGAITHEDSMGNRTTVAANEVQRMTAGTGVTHSEINRGAVACYLYQIWILPPRAGLTPSYDQKRFDPVTWEGRLAVVASGRGHAGAVALNADAVLFRAALKAGAAVTYELAAGRHGFIYAAQGEVAVNGHKIGAGDQGRIKHESLLTLEAGATGAAFVGIDVP